MRGRDVRGGEGACEIISVGSDSVSRTTGT